MNFFYINLEPHQTILWYILQSSNVIRTQGEGQSTYRHFCYFLSSWGSKVPSFIISFLFQILLSLLEKVSSWQIPLISFPTPENVMIPLLFLKNIFSGNRTLGWQSFSFNTWKMFCHFLLTSISVKGNLKLPDENPGNDPVPVWGLPLL